MPKGSSKGFIAAVVLIFLVVLPFILAGIPKGNGGITESFIVKKGTKLRKTAYLLEQNGLVRSKYLFLISSITLHKGKVVAGEYLLSPGMSPKEIARKMARGDRKVYTLKIVEGYTIYTTGEVVEKTGIMKSKDFLRLVSSPAFLSRLNIPAETCEGYLSPDTYFYSRETDMDEFLAKIIDRTTAFFEKDDLQKRMGELSMNSFQVLSLASIIEKEAKREEEKRLISSVFHNRLRIGMSLDADPTVIYGIANFNGNLTKNDLATATPYNTYRMKGLPKGPICNPSRSSIMAALYPEKTEYLYFVARNDGSHVFSKSIEEHNRFVGMYQKHKTRNHK
jgi:UPF0755 protein